MTTTKRDNRAAGETSGMTDLAKLDVSAAAEEGAELELLHPVTGKGLGGRIRVVGADSDRYRSAVRSVSSKRVHKRRRAPLTPEEVEEEGLDILVKATLEWRDIVVDGETLVFTKDNVRNLYRRFPWIREQVDGFISDRGNFLQD